AQLLIGSYAMMTLDWASGSPAPLAIDEVADGIAGMEGSNPGAFLPQLLAHVELLWQGLATHPAHRADQSGAQAEIIDPPGASKDRRDRRRTPVLNASVKRQ
ncbi:MAG: hypothetical protein ABI068_16175, partial [Ktedonobacterales bacterium]